MRDESVGPFVEIAQDDARTGNVRRLEQIFIHQEDRLRPPLAVRRSEMHVKNVHQMLAYADVGAQNSAFSRPGTVRSTRRTRSNGQRLRVTLPYTPPRCLRVSPMA